MNKLLEKYNDYMKLVGCKVHYELTNNYIINFIYKKENFLHLLGLHKLIDLQIVQFWLDMDNKSVKNNDVIKKIKNETFSDKHIKLSVHYDEIQERYESFNYNNLTTLNYTDAIINFNPKLINSSLKSDYMLFEKTQNNEYNYMGIAFDKSINTRYVETFFHRKSDDYIAGQKIEKISRFTIYDKNGKIIIDDNM